MYYDDDDDDDVRNARVREHGRRRSPWGFASPVRHTGGGSVTVRPPGGGRPYPMPPAPPMYPVPGYDAYGYPLMYGPHPLYPPARPSWLDGLDKGQAIEAGLLALGALRGVPPAPTITGTVATDMTNLAIQNQNNANFFRTAMLFASVGKLANAFIGG
jgi:hypothetical protein